MLSNYKIMIKISTLVILITKTRPFRINHPRFRYIVSKIQSSSKYLNNVDKPTNLMDLGYDDISTEYAQDDNLGPRETDFVQKRDLDEILMERALRFHDPSLVGKSKEKCVLVAVDRDRPPSEDEFSLKESLQELSELVGTAGLEVVGSCVQKLHNPNPKTYVGSGKISDIIYMLDSTDCSTIVVDDDLTSKQQRNLESSFESYNRTNVKILDRTAVILDIFAQHAKSREGQLQVELAMLEYRLTRGPRSTGTADVDKGAGFRGPGESKLELDKRMIKDRMLFVQKEIESRGNQRELHRQNRKKLGLPVVALVGYTNAGKSTVLNRLSRAGVLAENMLFATLDPTTRRVKLPRPSEMRSDQDGSVVSVGEQASESHASREAATKGPEIMLTDTVGFISKLPANLVAAFRATLEEVTLADVLVHVIDRSSPVWRKQRETVIRELDRIGCRPEAVIVELWNKFDRLQHMRQEIMEEIKSTPLDVDVDLEPDAADGYRGIGEGSSGVTVELEGEEDEDEYALLSEDTVFPEEGSKTPQQREGAQGRDRRAKRSDRSARIASHTSLEVAAQASDVNEIAIATVRGTGEAGVEGRVDGDRLVASNRYKRKTFIVAASAQTGEGMDAFVATLEDALSTLLTKIDVFIPYDRDDGVIASIHSQGAVDFIEYQNTGTLLKCRVPNVMAAKLEKWRVKIK